MLQIRILGKNLVTWIATTSNYRVKNFILRE